MPNPVTYRITKGPLSDEMQAAVVTLYERIFSTNKSHITKKLQRSDLRVIVAESDQGLVAGFKIGYPEKPDRFYSWLGGVHPDYRGQGIGSELMRRQHTYCRDSGFRVIRTKTTNHWRSMLLLNIRHGFRIIGTYLDDRNEVKIILEKLLTD